MLYVLFYYLLLVILCGKGFKVRKLFSLMVRAIMIVEMAGKPALHLTQTLEKHMNILNNVKGLSVNSISVSEAKLIEEIGGKKVSSGTEMFTAFAEADFEVEDFPMLTQVMFDFMPSSVEVVEPSNVSITSKEATDLLNNISGRLHRYDELAKIAGSRLQQMTEQFKKARELIDERDNEIKELSKDKSKPKKSTTKKKTTAKKPASKKKTTKKK